MDEEQRIIDSATAEDQYARILTKEQRQAIIAHLKTNKDNQTLTGLAANKEKIIASIFPDASPAAVERLDEFWDVHFAAMRKTIDGKAKEMKQPKILAIQQPSEDQKPKATPVIQEPSSTTTTTTTVQTTNNTSPTSSNTTTTTTTTTNTTNNGTGGTDACAAKTLAALRSSNAASSATAFVNNHPTVNVTAATAAKTNGNRSNDDVKDTGDEEAEEKEANGNDDDAGDEEDEANEAKEAKDKDEAANEAADDERGESGEDDDDDDDAEDEEARLAEYEVRRTKYHCMCEDESTTYSKKELEIMTPEEREALCLEGVLFETYSEDEKAAVKEHDDMKTWVVPTYLKKEKVEPRLKRRRTTKHAHAIESAFDKFIADSLNLIAANSPTTVVEHAKRLSKKEMEDNAEYNPTISSDSE